MKGRTAIIIIDSGFSREVLARARNNILAVHDVPSNTFVAGNDRSRLDWFAGDVYQNHGTEVLARVLQRRPESPLLLVRAFGTDKRLVRTEWTEGRVTRTGWVEAYLQAVEFCRTQGLSSVANCSFGGYVHAMDGTGWEAFNIGKVTGKGNRGHIMISGAGPGDGRPTHASTSLWPGEERVINAWQDGDTHYNFWARRPEGAWTLTVRMNGHTVFAVHSTDVPPNLWNGLKQQTLRLFGRGDVQFHVTCPSVVADVRSLLSFHCWVEGPALFANHVDPVAVAEPACLPSVIAVGLASSNYSPNQWLPGEKPDVLLPGGEQVSFRLPEVTVAVSRILDANANLDVDGVRALLGKMPNLMSPL